MPKLSDTYAQVKDSLHYPPNLAPFFEKLVAENEAQATRIAALEKKLWDMFPARSTEPPTYISQPNEEYLRAREYSGFDQKIGAQEIYANAAAQSVLSQADIQAMYKGHPFSNQNSAEPGITAVLVSPTPQPEPVSAEPVIEVPATDQPE